MISQALFNVCVCMCVDMSMTVFWDVAPCSLVEAYRRFRGACCLHHDGDRPDSHRHTRRRENLKSHYVRYVYVCAWMYI
jgi:hypothetical protein